MESGRCLVLGARASAHVPLAPLRQASGFIAIVTARVPRSSFYLAFPQAELLSHSLIPDSLVTRFRLAGGKKCVVLCVVLCVCARISPSATDSRSPTLLCLVLCARAAVFRHATKQTQKHGQHALLLHGRRVCLREVSDAPPPPCPPRLRLRRHRAHWFPAVCLASFYADFGPLNLAMLYRYCCKLNKKLKVSRLPPPPPSIGMSTGRLRAVALCHMRNHAPARLPARPAPCGIPKNKQKVEHILIVTPILFVDPSLCRSAARCGSVSPVLDQKAERSGFWGKPTSAAAATLSFPFFPKAQTVKQDRGERGIL